MFTLFFLPLLAFAAPIDEELAIEDLAVRFLFATVSHENKVLVNYLEPNSVMLKLGLFDFVTERVRIINDPRAFFFFKGGSFFNDAFYLISAARSHPVVSVFDREGRFISNLQLPQFKNWRHSWETLAVSPGFSEQQTMLTVMDVRGESPNKLVLIDFAKEEAQVLFTDEKNFALDGYSHIWLNHQQNIVQFTPEIGKIEWVDSHFKPTKLIKNFELPFEKKGNIANMLKGMRKQKGTNYAAVFLEYFLCGDRLSTIWVQYRDAFGNEREDTVNRSLTLSPSGEMRVSDNLLIGEHKNKRLHLNVLENTLHIETTAGQD